MAGPVMVRETIAKLRATGSFVELEPLFRGYCAHPIRWFEPEEKLALKKDLFWRAKHHPNGFLIQEVGNRIVHAIEGCEWGTWRSVDRDLEAIDLLLVELEARESEV
jgi:hypothetical protein